MNPKQERFVLEYLKDFNATQAAVRAGYSEKTAPQIASRMLNFVNVKNAINQAKSKSRERYGIAEQKIIDEISKIAFSSIDQYVSWDSSGNVQFKPSDQVDMACVAEVSQVWSEAGPAPKIKLHPKLPALIDLANRLIGVPKQSLEISGTLTLQQVRSELLGMIDVTPEENKE